MDKDSFILTSNGIDNANGPLAKFMDLSNFDVNHPSYNVAYKGKLFVCNRNVTLYYSIMTRARVLPKVVIEVVAKI